MKEPWEMTSAEYKADQKAKCKQLIQEWNKTLNSLAPPTAKLSIVEKIALAERAGFTPKTDAFKNAAVNWGEHKLQIAVAVREGKPVPHNVLEEYKNETGI